MTYEILLESGFNCDAKYHSSNFSKVVYFCIDDIYTKEQQEIHGTMEIDRNAAHFLKCKNFTERKSFQSLSLNKQGLSGKRDSGSGVRMQVTAWPKVQSEGGHPCRTTSTATVSRFFYTQLLPTTKNTAIQVGGILHSGKLLTTKPGDKPQNIHRRRQISNP